MRRKSNFKETQDLSHKIIDKIIKSEYSGEYNPTPDELYQARVNAEVDISNYVYQNSKEVRQEERFETIVKLARSMNDAELQKTISILGYKISTPEDEIIRNPAYDKADKLVEKILNERNPISDEEKKACYLEIFQLSIQLDAEDREKIFTRLEDKKFI